MVARDPNISNATDRLRVVERELVVEADPERVWDALTDESILADWFAPEAQLDPAVGGEVEFECEDGRRAGTVVRVEPERELAFTWARPGEDESLVEFTLEPVVGGTRIVVKERALGPTSAVSASAWRPRLHALEHCLAALIAV
jgi:uncharacterized protein YndB with AHSA1/START domain